VEFWLLQLFLELLWLRSFDDLKDDYESIINNISTLKNNFSWDVLNKYTIIDKTTDIKNSAENFVKEKLDNLINN